jgi:hypothetical protein
MPEGAIESRAALLPAPSLMRVPRQRGEEMGVLNATSTYGHDLQPTGVANEFSLMVYTGGFAGSREADARLAEEAAAFMQRHGFLRYGIVNRTHKLVPSGFEYVVHFSREPVAALAGGPQLAAAPPRAQSVAFVASSIPSWRATHVSPPAGLPFWDVPDANRPPAGMLPPGAELLADGSNGAWMHVRAVNGWQGWVDGRFLVACGQ